MQDPSEGPFLSPAATSNIRNSGYQSAVFLSNCNEQNSLPPSMNKIVIKLSLFQATEIVVFMTAATLSQSWLTVVSYY